MKLQCNVCLESPIVTLPLWPDSEDDTMLCPSCNKQLAWAIKAPLGKHPIWQPINTKYDAEWGGYPVSIIEH